VAVYRDVGVVVNTHDFSESSRIVVIAGRERGVLRLVAKGVRRAKARYGTALDRLSTVGVVYSRKVEAELGTLRTASLVADRGELSRKYERLVYASAAAELIERLLRPYDPNPIVVSRFEKTLDALSALDGDDLTRLFWAFVWFAVANVGLAPQLDVCVATGKRYTSGPARFSCRQGGLVSSEAAGRLPQRDLVSLSGEAVTALRRWLAGERAAVSPDDASALGVAAEGFLREHVPGFRAFRSLESHERRGDG
jgi:DNA repair protein RecO (recombination protein O)